MKEVGMGPPEANLEKSKEAGGQSREGRGPGCGSWRVAWAPGFYFV